MQCRRPPAGGGQASAGLAAGGNGAAGHGAAGTVPGGYGASIEARFHRARYLGGTVPGGTVPWRHGMWCRLDMVPPIADTVPGGTVLWRGGFRRAIARRMVPAIAGTVPGGRGKAPTGPCGDAETSLGLVQSIDCTIPGLPAGECGLCGISTWRSGEMSLCPERPMCRGRHAARRAWRWESVSPPSRPCPLIPRLLVRKLGFWRPALPAPRVPCPDPRCPGTVQEPRASSRHGRPRNGLGHAPTRKSAEPAASVACLQ